MIGTEEDERPRGVGIFRHLRWLTGSRPQLTALYLAGVVHWLVFFRAGRLSFSACDWPKEQFYLSAIRHAFRAHELPYFVAISSEFARSFPQLQLTSAGAGQTFCALLSIPELSTSPQLVLLRWLSPGAFVIVNVLLLYSLGFIGLLGIRARYELSGLPFVVLFLLFNFNGHVVAHLAVGHSMWSGYFLMSFFVLYLLKWVEQPRARSASVQLALVLFGMALQGAIHLMMAGVVTVALAAACTVGLRRSGLFVLALTGLLAAVRALPALILVWHMPPAHFFGGFATLSDALAALVSIRGPEFPAQHGIFGALGWWEYDTYVGELGALTLGYFGVWQAFKARHSEVGRRSLLRVPLLGVAMLTLNVVAFPLFALKVPFLANERVTSRLLIIPLLVLVVVACIRLQESLSVYNTTRLSRAVTTSAVAIEALSLVAHSERWSLAVLERTPTLAWHELNGPVALVQAQPSWGVLYRSSLAVGAAVSALTLGCSCLLLWRFLRQEQARPARMPAARRCSTLNAGRT